MHLIYSRLTAKGEEVKGKKQKTPEARAREKRGDLAGIRSKQYSFLFR